MAKRGGYRSDKRRKETDRLKKQEEKRQRRFNKGLAGEAEPENGEGESTTEEEGTAKEGTTEEGE